MTYSSQPFYAFLGSAAKTKAFGRVGKKKKGKKKTNCHVAFLGSVAKTKALGRMNLKKKKTLISHVLNM